MKLFDVKIIKTQFGVMSLQKKLNKTCCVCQEDFTNESWVRETPCKHLFHNNCLMDWIKIKLPNTDCPFCRAEIKV